MKEIRIRLPEEVVDQLDRISQERGISRSEVARQRIGGVIMGVPEFRRLCADAQKHVGNVVPPRFIESLVGFTLSRGLGLAEESIQAPPSSRPPAAE